MGAEHPSYRRRFTFPPRCPGRPAVDRPSALAASETARSTACCRARGSSETTRSTVSRRLISSRSRGYKAIDFVCESLWG